jgi:hypothetical protein
MLTPLASSSVILKSIFFCADTYKINYVVSVDDVEMILTGQLHEARGVRGVKCSDELEQLLMALMPLDRSVSKRLSAISWAHAEGKTVDLPTPLILLG